MSCAALFNVQFFTTESTEFTEKRFVSVFSVTSVVIDFSLGALLEA